MGTGLRAWPPRQLLGTQRSHKRQGGGRAGVPGPLCGACARAQGTEALWATSPQPRESGYHLWSPVRQGVTSVPRELGCYLCSPVGGSVGRGTEE